MLRYAGYYWAQAVGAGRVRGDGGVLTGCRSPALHSSIHVRLPILFVGVFVCVFGVCVDVFADWFTVFANSGTECRAMPRLGDMISVAGDDVHICI